MNDYGGDHRNDEPGRGRDSQPPHAVDEQPDPQAGGRGRLERSDDAVHAVVEAEAFGIGPHRRGTDDLGDARAEKGDGDERGHDKGECFHTAESPTRRRHRQVLFTVGHSHTSRVSTRECIDVEAHIAFHLCPWTPPSAGAASRRHCDADPTETLPTVTATGHGGYATNGYILD